MQNEHIPASPEEGNSCVQLVDEWLKETAHIVLAILNTGVPATAKSLAIKLLLTSPSGRGRFRIAQVMLWASLKNRRSATVVVKALVGAGVISIVSSPRGRDAHYSYAMDRTKVMAWATENALEPPRDASSKARKELARADGAYTHEDLWRIYNKQNGCCAACKKEKRLTIDHIVPVADGGSNLSKNIQLLCRSCNSRKNRKDAVAFMQSMGALL